jgi:hypothetical protein
MAGFPYWEIAFDKDANQADPAAVTSLVSEARGGAFTDLYVFSHGWNNEGWKARRLYERFFTELRAVISRRSAAPGVKAAAAGVIWPSILFPDDEPEESSGGAAGFEEAAPADLTTDLKKVFADQPDTIDEIMRLLDEQPDDPAQIERFQQLLRLLAPAEAEFEDSGEKALLNSPAEKVFDTMADLASPDREAAAGLLDGVQRLWQGAKEALRVMTYWNMKERAGIIGVRALGPLVGRLNQAAPELRVHLLGHSFGARVVSFALKGLPAGLDKARSPVKSLFLLQGAFSHFAFADALPHDPQRSGALKGMASRVDGPIVVTCSEHDLAVCKRYPQASFISREDAADFNDAASRWGAMGSRGAQAVGATVLPFGPEGQNYQFTKGRFFTLDGNHLITRGGPPSGAHSDIVYPEIAWAVMKASGLAREAGTATT